MITKVKIDKELLITEEEQKYSDRLDEGRGCTIWFGEATKCDFDSAFIFIRDKDKKIELKLYQLCLECDNSIDIDITKLTNDEVMLLKELVFFLLIHKRISKLD